MTPDEIFGGQNLRGASPCPQDVAGMQPSPAWSDSRVCFHPGDRAGGKTSSQPVSLLPSNSRLPERSQEFLSPKLGWLCVNSGPAAPQFLLRRIEEGLSRGSQARGESQGSLACWARRGGGDSEEQHSLPFGGAQAPPWRKRQGTVAPPRGGHTWAGTGGVCPSAGLS